MKILKADEYIGEKLEIEPVSKERLGKYIHKEYEDAGLTDEQAKEFIAKQKLTYNPITKCYDSEHSVFIDNKIIAKDGDGFKINFGYVKGNFFADNKNLKSLKGAPKKVGYEFRCENNPMLESLEGVPKKVGSNFNCSNCKALTSLVGAPSEINGNFYCKGCSLTDLKGAPQKVKHVFSCCDNNLVTLEGAPQYVGGTFDCSGNNLSDLKGSPRAVGGSFICSFNELKSLVGAPQKVGKDFDCTNNLSLKSTKSKPKRIGGKFKLY